MVAAGVVVGEGLAYWADAVRLARPLVARQQFLPDMVSESSSCWEVWTPVLEGVDAERFGWLVGRMARHSHPACSGVLWGRRPA